MGIISTTDEKFSEDVINSDLPVLIDFWAEWCGPCKMIGPILEELAIEMNEKIKMVKIDVDANSQTAVNYAIRSIPTLIIMKDGEVVAQHIGAASKVPIREFYKSKYLKMPSNGRRKRSSLKKDFSEIGKRLSRQKM